MRPYRILVRLPRLSSLIIPCGSFSPPALILSLLWVYLSLPVAVSYHLYLYCVRSNKELIIPSNSFHRSRIPPFFPRLVWKILHLESTSQTTINLPHILKGYHLARTICTQVNYIKLNRTCTNL